MSSMNGGGLTSGGAVLTSLARSEAVSEGRSAVSAKTSMVPSAWSSVSRWMSLS